MSRRQNELVGKFKMAASDLVGVRGQVMEYTYIPLGIKKEMVRSGVDCHWKGQVVGTVGRRPMPIHSSGKIISSLPHIEGITLGAVEEVDEVAGGAGGMGVDGIGGTFHQLSSDAIFACVQKHLLSFD